MRHLPTIVAIVAACSLYGLSRLPAAEPTGESATSGQIAFFESKIRPVLVQHCYECHSAQSDNVKGGLTLDTRQGMRGGGDSGQAVVPGDTNQSLLIEALRYESYEMPPAGKLPEQVIADFVKWVEMGAPDPRESNAPTSSRTSDEIDWSAARQFWAFQPPQRHAARQADDPWVRRPIDGFVMDRLRVAGLDPSPQADRRILIRRLSFDLIGLPPTPDEVEAFVADDSPTAYESLVDRLLASPRYGERWTQMWLDLMRYAEDQAHIVGNNTSLFFPNAYLYRNWLIDAFNEDLPYDEFICLQLAADLLHPDHRDLHVATGFIGLGPKYYRRNSPEVQAEEWENQVDTLTRGLLGLTVACARCHDHKYDPIPTEDYYALAGVFAGTELVNRPLTDVAKTKKDGEAEKAEEAVHVVRDSDPRDLNVMIRGDVANKGPIVPRRFLRVLCGDEPEAFSQGDSGRRELAAAIAAPENPLTARVIVNRIWGAHFGRPLVATPSNFGQLGERPTHPELLDDLAVRFMEQGWSLKWLHRELVLSATYQQSSHADEAARHQDPGNLLLGRMNRRRLSVEQWRDAILAAGGVLETSIGGESIVPSDPESSRRTVYATRSRFELDPMLALFDFPDPSIHSGRRVETTTPLQKLFVLNSPFMVRQAERICERARSTGEGNARAIIEQLYQLLYNRLPAEEELQLGIEYVGPNEVRWTAYTQTLLAANELLILD